MVKEFLSSTPPVVNLTVDENHPPSASISASLPSPHETSEEKEEKQNKLEQKEVVVTKEILNLTADDSSEEKKEKQNKLEQKELVVTKEVFSGDADVVIKLTDDDSL
jgi:hypothetical protein